MDTRVYAKIGAFVALGLGLVAAVVGVLPGLLFLATPLLGAAVLSLAVGAGIAGSRPPPPIEDEDDDARFRRELVRNTLAGGLRFAFLLLMLVEALTIPAALGLLTFFGSFALGFVQFFPAILFGFLALLALAFLQNLKSPSAKKIEGREHVIAWGGLAVAVVFTLYALLVAVGAGGLNPERAVFVLAAGLVGLYFFTQTWNRMPDLAHAMEWMENEDRLRAAGLTRKTMLAFLALAGIGILLSLASATPFVPRSVGLLGLALTMIAFLPATFSVGLRPYVSKLHEGETNRAEERKRTKVILNWVSIGLTGLAGVLGVSTFLAFLAQVAGVELFRSLLDLFVQQYPIILGVAMAPVIAALYFRTQFEGDDRYTDARKAITLYSSLFTVVCAFFGAFIGSGMAEGTGIEIENAVLFMATGAIALLVFVKTRALFPGVIAMIRASITASAEADESLKENIQRNMIITYVAGLLFILGFVAYIAMTSLGVLPQPGSGLGTDAGFFFYVLVGLGLLVVVLMRYFQSVNIDPRWKKQEKDDIGKKRLSAEELNRYIVLGFSISAATILMAMGILVQMGFLTKLGPLALDKKFATDFFVFAILLGLGPYGFYYNREMKRIRAIDTKFPEFLRDLAESQRSGMTLTEAVITSAKGSYGDLTPEIRKMAAQIEWGVSFGDALERFADRVKTPLIERTVSLIIQAQAAGGNVVDVLTAASDDAREIQMILKERKQSMSIYVMIIYIAFFVFMGVIGILNAQFIPEVAKAVSKADGVSIGGLKFTKIDEQAFKTLFFHAALVQGLGGGLVAGVMDGGKPVAGLKHSFILVTISYIVFRFLIGG